MTPDGTHPTIERRSAAPFAGVPSVPVAPAREARVVIALPHPRLRTALARALDLPGAISVVGQASDLIGAVDVTRALHADGLVLGAAVLRGDVVGDLRHVVAALPEVHVVVLGSETSVAYASAMRAAGAADYVSLDQGTDPLVSAVRRTHPEAPTAAA
jgi:DNA-binding NarL/FixJ family response regulator